MAACSLLNREVEFACSWTANCSRRPFWISALVRAEAQQGLLSVAFHPIYLSNGLFYVIYTDIDGNTVIARYAVSPDDRMLLIRPVACRC